MVETNAYLQISLLYDYSMGQSLIIGKLVLLLARHSHVTLWALTGRGCWYLIAFVGCWQMMASAADLVATVSGANMELGAQSFVVSLSPDFLNH